uniref:Uncharacterized protein n=1 Tax=Rhizophora mucronata TaxID=61149 RepID=A0A2P2PLK6_RHIMU
MLSQSQSHFLSRIPNPPLPFHSFPLAGFSSLCFQPNTLVAALKARIPTSLHLKTRFKFRMSSNSRLSDLTDPLFSDFDLDRLVGVANSLADASGDVIRKYFRKKFDILDKEDLSPVTIADKAAEESMVSIILENFPFHAMFVIAVMERRMAGGVKKSFRTMFGF